MGGSQRKGLVLFIVELQRLVDIIDCVNNINLSTQNLECCFAGKLLNKLWKLPKCLKVPTCNVPSIAVTRMIGHLGREQQGRTANTMCSGLACSGLTVTRVENKNISVVTVVFRSPTVQLDVTSVVGITASQVKC